MPHKCARCRTIYLDGSPELLTGCNCGSKVFLYIRHMPDEDEEDVLAELERHNLARKDIQWIEEEFEKKAPQDAKKKTIHLDVENLRRVGEGKFELDVSSLMSGKPIVVKAEEGVYYIDLPYAMRVKPK